MSPSLNENGNWNRATKPIFNAPPCVLVLIAVLVAIHGALQYGGESWYVYSLYLFSLNPARFTDASFRMVQGSQYWSLLSYGFLHADWTHVLFNCLWLLIFGTPAARYLGNLRFLALCAIATIAGGLGSLAYHWGSVVFVVGASGAVSGLLAAAIPVMYGEKTFEGVRPLMPGELVRNRGALIFVAVWLGITLMTGATGWTGNSFVQEGGIAWEAHLAGFLGGLAGFYALAQRAVRNS